MGSFTLPCDKVYCTCNQCRSLFLEFPMAVAGSSSIEYVAPCFVNGGTALSLSSRDVENLTGGCALPCHATPSPAVRD